MPELGVLYGEITKLLAAIFHLLAFGFGHREDNPGAVRCPPKAFDAFLRIGDRLGLSAVRPNQINLLLLSACRQKCDPAAVRRPLG